ncbi:MAG: hypothetical protein L0H93_09620 [Nocardioides sp.]|nr:hypothetical protein [Nocardioides sp.]
MEGPAEQRTMPSSLGPLSVVGVCVGMIAWVAPAFYGGMSVWLIALPLSGLLMLVLPVSPLRHLGLGLVASVLVWPFTVIGVLGLPGILD